MKDPKGHGSNGKGASTLQKRFAAQAAAFGGRPPTTLRTAQPAVSSQAAQVELASGSPKSTVAPTHDSMAGVGPNSPLAGSRDYDAFGRPRADKSSYDEYSRDLAYRSRQGNGGIGSGGRR